MIKFNGDERFADVEYIGLHHDYLRRELVLEVSSDPADNCAAIFLRDVAAFDVVHFTRQNVIQYLDVARVAHSDLQGFLDLARKEGASGAFYAEPISDDVLLGVVFVAANGATIFAVCRAVEKCTVDGRPIYCSKA
jgi:hypothetical protein